ncbi:MAG: DUF3341 domain-containing protein [Bacteroidetes bacterium]|jgi:hypothetical protein|nr:DUF3341 domain-containing protein [Bacteroidota bacterium]
MSSTLINRTPCVVGVFDDDDVFLDACKKLKSKNLKVLDTFTPFPIHGIEKVLDVPRSNLAIAAFMFGTFGFIVGVALQVGLAGFDWPNNFGGKPPVAIPAFVPIIFELTILCASLGMVATYFFRSSLMPGFEPKIYDRHATSHHFVVLVEKTPGMRGEIIEIVKNAGAIEVRDDEYLEQNAPFPLPIKMI